jgi:hypothetical protein
MTTESAHPGQRFNEDVGKEVVNLWTIYQVTAPDGKEPSVEDLFVKLHEALEPT